MIIYQRSLGTKAQVPPDSSHLLAHSKTFLVGSFLVSATVAVISYFVIFHLVGSYKKRKTYKRICVIKKMGYIETTFAHGNGPYARTGEWAIAVNDERENRGLSRLPIIVPLVYPGRQERILKEEASIAFSDVAKYFDENGYLIRNPAKLPSVIRRAISSVKRVSNNKTGQERYEVTLWNKGDSLSRLQKVMGMNSPTEHKIDGNMQVETTVVHRIDLSSLSEYDISVLKDVQKKLKVIDIPEVN